MKTIKSIIIASVLVCIGIVAQAQSFIVSLKNGDQHQIEYSKSTLSGKGVELDNGNVIEYLNVKNISTDNFKAYEKASKRIQKKGSRHIKLEFTGDKNVHLQKLEQLENRRTGAHAARAGGGILAIIGAVSGNRDLFNAGVVTYGAGTIARDINTEKTISTQNQMLQELDENQNKPQEETA